MNNFDVEKWKYLAFFANNKCYRSASSREARRFMHSAESVVSMWVHTSGRSKKFLLWKINEIFNLLSNNKRSQKWMNIFGWIKEENLTDRCGKE